MKTNAEVMNKMNMIISEMRETESNKMNVMLDPQPCGCDVDLSTTRIRYEAQDWEKNHRDEIHGGVVCSMFDLAMGMSVLAFSDSPSVATADLDVSFIRPFTGNSFIFEINIIHLGRRITRVRAAATDEENGKLLASASANFVYAGK